MSPHCTSRGFAAVSQPALIFLLCILLFGFSGVARSASPGGNTQDSGGTPDETNRSSGAGRDGRRRPNANGAIVYIAGSTDTTAFIDARTVDAGSGTLTPISGSPFSIGHSRAGDIALSADGRFAYVIVTDFPGGTCCVGSASMAAIRLDPVTGAPTAQQAVPVPGNASLGHLFVHPSGKFVYASYVDLSANFASGFAIFAVRSDGTLAFKALASAHNSGGSVFDPNGLFVYTDEDDGQASNWGNAACGPIFSHVFGYRVSTRTGALTPLFRNPVTFQRNVCEVGTAPSYVTEQIDPAGTRLFLVDVGNQTITEFAINPSSGALRKLPTTTRNTGVFGYTSSAMDPKGRFLYVGSTVDSFTGFSLAHATSPLPVLPGMPAQASPLPFFNEGSTNLAVDPSGTFLFSNENGFTSNFGCCLSDNMVGFRINQATGSLRQLPAMPSLPGTTGGIAIRPGKFR